MILAHFVRDTLIASGLFDLRKRKQIEKDIGRLLDYQYPETEDDVYDRLTRRVVDWCRAHPEPVPHPPNAKLRR